MSMSNTNTATATATVIALIEYLTQPLTNAHYPLATISILKSTLFTHFAYLFSSGTLAPFTLILSPHTLPPAPILAACTSSGISWVQWMNLITSGNPNVLVFIMQGSIRQGQKVVWSADKMCLVKKEEDTAQSPMTSRLNTLLDSVRARRQTTTLPQFNDDSDSDSDSDAESTPSFAFSSDEDTSSVSSAASSPASTKVELPLVHEEKPYVPPAVNAGPKYRPPFRARTQNQTRTQAKPMPTVTRYMYEGGQTGVITGGVMLGGASKKVQSQGQNQNTTTAKPTASSTWRRPNTNTGTSDNNNWRRRAPRV